MNLSENVVRELRAVEEVRESKGRELRGVRESKGLTQIAAAKLLKLQQSNYAGYEAGRTPATVTYLEGLIEALRGAPKADPSSERQLGVSMPVRAYFDNESEAELANTLTPVERASALVRAAREKGI